MHVKNVCSNSQNVMCQIENDLLKNEILCETGHALVECQEKVTQGCGDQVGKLYRISVDVGQELMAEPNDKNDVYCPTYCENVEKYDIYESNTAIKITEPEKGTYEFERNEIQNKHEMSEKQHIEQMCEGKCEIHTIEKPREKIENVDEKEMLDHMVTMNGGSSAKSSNPVCVQNNCYVQNDFIIESETVCNSPANENVKKCDEYQSTLDKNYDIFAWTNSEENGYTNVNIYDSGSYLKSKSKENIENLILVPQKRTDPPDKLLF